MQQVQTSNELRKIIETSDDDVDEKETIPVRNRQIGEDREDKEEKEEEVVVGAAGNGALMKCQRDILKIFVSTHAWRRTRRPMERDEAAPRWMKKKGRNPEKRSDGVRRRRTS